jgi:alpha-ribazole phosphatase/probable phosphoglycerate mutase
MVKIIFEAHGTTFDNEAHLSSGHNDIALSPLGIQQSKEMGERYKDEHFNAIFCSDLQRAYKSAQIAFGDKFPIIKDRRLRECDYGDFTQKPSEVVDEQKPLRLTEPFPNGESYADTTERMRHFLINLFSDYEGKRVMVIGHRATQYGLDNLIKHVPMKQLVSTHFKWQPGWAYELTHGIPTKQTQLLSDALKERNVHHEIEYFDGHKHIDIAIPSAKIFIEVDGIHHYTDSEQIKRDFKRDHFSDGDDFSTIHIPNEIAESHRKEVADAIAQVVRGRQLSR